MFTVYVLYSKTFNKIYIGCTSNLEARLKSHNELGVRDWAIRYRPWEVVFTEIFVAKQDAMKREKILKSGKGREMIWNIIKENNLA